MMPSGFNAPSTLAARLGGTSPQGRAAQPGAGADQPVRPGPPTAGAMSATDGADRRLGTLTGLLQLERHARAARSAQALAFIMVNDTHTLLPYRQAWLWQAGTGRITAASGLAVVQADAPFIHWASGWCARRAASEPLAQATGPLAVDAEGDTEADRAMRAEHLPAHLLWVPLQRPEQPLLGALLLGREQATSAAQLALLGLLGDAYAHAWAALHPPLRGARRWLRPSRRRALTWGAAALLGGMLLLPVRQSVLAPAELVARDPAVVRAPLQGVVDDVLVAPNQPVEAGTPLVRLDGRELDNRLEVARQAYAVAEAELRQARQQALIDARSKAVLAVAQGKRDHAAADVGFYEEAVARLNVVAPRAGVAIFDDRSDWIGKPLAVGERIMMVADPHDAQVQVSLPVGDSLALEAGSEVRVFLNGDPLNPLTAQLEHVGYRAAAQPDGSMAYRLRAHFPQADARIRVGLKGTAKLYGNRTTVFQYLMRRPLSALRMRLGW